MDFLRYVTLVAVFALAWALIVRFGPVYGPQVYELFLGLEPRESSEAMKKAE